MSDINVTIVAATNASTSILNSDTISVSLGAGTQSTGSISVSTGPGFVGGGATALLVEAGANITVTTAQGSFMVSGRDIPVLSVNGRTGAVVLTSSDIGGLTSVANVTKVNGRTGAVTLVSTDVSAASAVHSHVAANIADLTSVANVISVAGRTGAVTLGASDIGGLTSVANVTKVNGRTGAVTLVSTDVSAASAVHSHVASEITDLTSKANVVSVNGITGSPSIVAGANVTVSTSGSSITISASGGGGTTGGAVSSVNGKTGTVVLTSVEVSAASASHSHVAANVTDLTSVANVVSVNGRTGSVVITSVDASAASASHSHVAANVTDLTSVANVVSVNGRTGVVTLVAADMTAASATHEHGYVTSLNGGTGNLTVVGGSNITVTTSVGSITVASAGAQGPKGDTGSFGDPQTIHAKTASYTLQLADVGSLLTFAGTASAATITVTIPQESNVAWVAGSHIDIARIGDSKVVVGGSISVLATPSPELRDTYSGGSLVYLGGDQWLLVGDLA